MKFKTIIMMSALGMALLDQAAWAGNITNITVASLPGNQKIIKIRFDRDVATPSGFVTDAPARIALDFADTGLQLPQPVLEYNDSLLKQIAAAQSTERARLMLSLALPSKYHTEIKNNEVWVYVQENTGKAPAATSANIRADVEETRSESADMLAMLPNIGIDFRKGAYGSGLIDINISNYSGRPDIKQQADRLVLTYKNAPLPSAQQRNLDVTDFNTPVRTIALRRLGNDTQLTIRMQGGWSYSQTSGSNRHTLEISPKVNMVSSGLKPQNKSFSGRRVSLDFQDVEVRTILQILAKESGMNIVASDSVQGKMTISLKDVPWDQALDLVMQARNLDMRKQGNIINIAPREELLAKDKTALQAQNELETLGPLVSQTFQLRYKSVEEFRKILNIGDNGGSGSNSILTSRGSALIDPASNTLIITDTPNIIQKFERLVAQLDVPLQQVMIEARIVEAQDGFSRELGVRFGSRYDRGGTRIGGFGSGNLGDYGSSQFGIPNVNLPVSAPTSALSLIRSTASGALGLELSAMQAENRGKIISSPRVLTQDRKEAIIESGTDVPYQEATSSGASSTSFKKAVLGLKVTPQITPDGNVIMDIQINKDSPTDCNSFNGPCINTKSLNTKAMVEDGGTLILGGIYEEDNSNSQRKVPLLGDIPVVGNLFKYQKRENKRHELLIFITPRIMGNSGSTLRY